MVDHGVTKISLAPSSLGTPGFPAPQSRTGLVDEELLRGCAATKSLYLSIY